ncbi:MAG TPA: Holliday junction DNA helicase RuvB C-terminal domain-containing protein, partial [Actinomycetota bacterium]|nr:Holliday junction DNA helicase RuvB C-terminal domain-containing protein [Actinomycetota bacterium]
VRRSAAILAIVMEPHAAEEIAVRSRGTPRIANRLLRRVRDFAQVRAAGRVSLAVARDALDLFEVDAEGLDKVDMAILSALADRFRGRPVGLNTLAVAVGEEPDTIEDVYEPYLLRKGFIQRTPRGRLATVSAYEHLGLREAFERLV